MLREAVARWQVGRVRRAYTSVGGPVSAAPGYAGMIEEMRRGLTHLSPPARRLADDRVLAAIFFGPIGVWSLRLLGRAAPGPTARALAAAAPLALAWLVGEIRWTGDRRDVVPECGFRRDGGPELCASVCKAPTERFCGDSGFPVVLTPDPESLRCDWDWSRVTR